MMTYELWEMYMRQTFIILLKAGPQNNARLKPVRSAKKVVADPCATVNKTNERSVINCTTTLQF